MEERIKDRWSDDTVLPIISYILNSAYSTEKGVIPFEATFGSQSAIYSKLPLDLPMGDRAHKYVQLLNENLRILTEASRKYQAAIVEKRTKVTPAHLQNKYQAGDFVLSTRKGIFLPSKLSPKYEGPWVVIKQYKNDVECRHLSMGVIKTMHVENLKLFFGSEREAKELAELDFDQHQVSRVLSWRGNPMERTTMEFEVLFADGERVWLTWCKDLYDTTHFEEYCRSTPPVYHLIFKLQESNSFIREIKKKGIISVSPGDIVYVDLRYFGSEWYRQLALPDAWSVEYVVAVEYTKWAKKSSNLKIVGECKIFKEVNTYDAYFVYAFGAAKSFSDERMKLVDADFVKQFPNVVEK